jgi:hypothetical protein
MTPQPETAEHKEVPHRSYPRMRGEPGPRGHFHGFTPAERGAATVYQGGTLEC